MNSPRYNISLHIRILLSIFVACGMLVSPAEAKPSAASKKGNVAVKSTNTKTAGKSKKTSSRRRAARRSAPRQSAPTPERYREIQQALTDKGYSAGPVDGSWGTEWVSALKKFQADQNLASDGKLGSLSLIALGLGPKRDSITEFAGKPGTIE